MVIEKTFMVTENSMGVLNRFVQLNLKRRGDFVWLTKNKPRLALALLFSFVETLVTAGPQPPLIPQKGVSEFDTMQQYYDKVPEEYNGVAVKVTYTVYGKRRFQYIGTFTFYVSPMG